MKGYIQSVGVELEGMIPYKYADSIDKWIPKYLKHPERYIPGEDGSVYGEDQCQTGEWRYWGQPEDIKQFLDVMFGKYEYRGNNSCGFHVHIKADKKVYEYAKCEYFWKEFEKAYRKRALRRPRYTERLRNTYCSFNFDKNGYYDHLKDRGAINIGSIEDKGTLEIRILPYQTSSIEGYNNIKWLVKTINNIVRKMDGKDKKVYEKEAQLITRLALDQ